MQDATRITLKNRTGLQLAPVQGKEMLEVTTFEVPDTTAEVDASAPRGKVLDEATLRRSYIAESTPLGTVPPPLSIKGAAKSAVKMLTGNRPQVFLDKLSERSAFERGGTRLYDGLLLKFRAASAAGGIAARDDGGLAEAGVDPLTEGALQEIRTQEAEHFNLLVACIEELGGDPTVQTPSADLVGVQTLGLLQTISDPRTSLVQGLHAALAAELIDVAGWELLIELATALGHDTMVERFGVALEEENEHLRLVRNWYASSTLADSGNASSYVATG